MIKQFSFPLPPEFEETRKKLLDALAPALQQQEQLRKVIDAASASFPRICINNHQISDSINNIIKYSSIPGWSFSELEKQLQTSLNRWNSGYFELAQKAIEAQENYNFAVNLLLLEDSPLKVWGSYGWTISPRARINHFYLVPKSKEEADNYMNKIHNDRASMRTIEILKECKFHNLKDIEEVEDLYKNEHYKSCSLLLFSLIESLLLHTEQESQHLNRLKTGRGAIPYYEQIAKPDDCSELALRVLCYISSTKALQAFFADGDNLQNRNPVLNRNLCCHGVFWRDVTKTDCSQLILLYENMLLCVEMI